MIITLDCNTKGRVVTKIIVGNTVLKYFQEDKVHFGDIAVTIIDTKLDKICYFKLATLEPLSSIINKLNIEGELNFLEIESFF